MLIEIFYLNMTCHFTIHPSIILCVQLILKMTSSWDTRVQYSLIEADRRFIYNLVNYRAILSLVIWKLLRIVHLPCIYEHSQAALLLYYITLQGVSRVAGWTTGRSRFDPRQRREDSSFGLCVHSRLWGPPNLLLWVPGVLSPGIKRGLGVTLTTHTHLPRCKISRSYTSSPPIPFAAYIGTALVLTSQGFKKMFVPNTYCWIPSRE
jgi:hypothetical protein